MDAGGIGYRISAEYDDSEDTPPVAGLVLVLQYCSVPGVLPIVELVGLPYGIKVQGTFRGVSSQGGANHLLLAQVGTHEPLESSSNLLVRHITGHSSFENLPRTSASLNAPSPSHL